MTNLTEKLDEVQAQMAAEHTALMAALALAQTQLVSINNALYYDDRGTLLSLATLSYNSWQVLMEVSFNGLQLYSQLEAINTKLLALATTNAYLDNIAVDTGALSTNVLALKTATGTPTGDATTTQLGRLTAIENLLSTIESKFGIPGDASETVLARLTAIQNCICLVAGDVPTPPTTDECEEPFTNTGQVFIPTWPGFGTGVTVAKFDHPLPAGVEFGTIFGLVEDGTELHAVLGWEGVPVWVESAAPLFAISPLDVVRYPTNQWVVLPDKDDIAFSVDADYSIKVYICAEFTVCTQAETFEIFSQAFSTPYESIEVDLDGHTVLWVSWVGNPADAVTFSFSIDGVEQFSEVEDGTGQERLFITSGSVVQMAATGGTNGFWRIGHCTGG